ncbi:MULTISPECIES: MepB family protein [Brochothrix]|uniref:MepB protein n=1 Tax=Brochothrix thermosphacta TaxID=2756 RepID=A0A1D2LGJ7_BROTH|nr:MULTISPECIES: MepB family protein [Brochothrix]ATF25958.1 hypothetical protein CNY62_05825 [Brochothrix thermosphacta]ATH85298.1 hypothetical protein CPF12_05415 [Brochothrix thermosphacta]MBR5525716.1 MepB family protein [Brochothrix sp.]MPQ28950.1 hypothetical protein [Brochothrix thermosphacta]ODJ49077.1 hypothetical protein BFR34_07245 [Brochothrix thermosphacta DSM 20171 = FSL F6-1036]
MVYINPIDIPILKKILNYSDVTITEVLPETQNAEYDAFRFTIAGHTARFRKAKITPKKNGQFVAFWEKNTGGKNQPFHVNNTPDLLIIAVNDSLNTGYFIFPKHILITKKIISNNNSIGKMAMRIYPPWDLAMSTQAQKTQIWQNHFFHSDISKKTLHTIC